MIQEAIRFALFALLGATAVSSVGANPYYDPSKPHHTPTGFRNNYIQEVAKPFSQLLRWRFQAWRDDLPRPAEAPTPVVLPDLARVRGNSSAARMRPASAGVAPVPSATWIGHATVLMQSGGLNILTDPVFSERASPITFLGPRRAQPAGIALDALPPIDVVLVSHNHYDHLDRVSAVRLNELSQGRTLFLVPLGNKPWMNDLGIHNVVELDWWDMHRVGGVEFHLTPVQHWSARSLGDRNQTLWGGWAVLAPDLHWYFSGDAGYSLDFTDTRQRFAGRQGPRGFDLALIPIGAYEPRWFMQAQHINPAEAVQVHRDLGARQSLGVHWGTFSLTDESLDQPPRDLAQARGLQGLSEQDFFLLKIGETRWLQPRPAAPSHP
ncbi:MAG TPA: MBL fold metallo-hydrolase [Ramlibacter sp.]|nr:MBL fold metallo-hydrolase [Ramlibacter sp.]